MLKLRLIRRICLCLCLYLYSIYIDKLFKFVIQLVSMAIIIAWFWWLILVLIFYCNFYLSCFLNFIHLSLNLNLSQSLSWNLNLMNSCSMQISDYFSSPNYKYIAWQSPSQTNTLTQKPEIFSRSTP